MRIFLLTFEFNSWKIQKKFFSLLLYFNIRKWKKKTKHSISLLFQFRSFFSFLCCLNMEFGLRHWSWKRVCRPRFELEVPIEIRGWLHCCDSSTVRICIIRLSCIFSISIGILIEKLRFVSSSLLCSWCEWKYDKRRTRCVWDLWVIREFFNFFFEQRGFWESCLSVSSGFNLLKSWCSCCVALFDVGIDDMNIQLMAEFWSNQPLFCFAITRIHTPLLIWIYFLYGSEAVTIQSESLIWASKLTACLSFVV